MYFKTFRLRKYLLNNKNNQSVRGHWTVKKILVPNVYYNAVYFVGSKSLGTDFGNLGDSN